MVKVNGPEVKKLREALGDALGVDMTQDKFSEIAGVSQSYISKLERNAPNFEPSLRKLAKIANALGVPIGQLLEEQGTQPE